MNRATGGWSFWPHKVTEIAIGWDFVWPVVALQFMGYVQAQPKETPNHKSYWLSGTFRFFSGLKYILLASHTTRHTHFSYEMYVRARWVFHASTCLSPIHLHRDSIIKIAPSWSHSNDHICGLPMTAARTCLAWIHLSNFRNVILKSILHIRKRVALWDGKESSFGKDMLDIWFWEQTVSLSDTLQDKPCLYHNMPHHKIKGLKGQKPTA